MIFFFFAKLLVLNLSLNKLFALRFFDNNFHFLVVPFPEVGLLFVALSWFKECEHFHWLKPSVFYWLGVEIRSRDRHYIGYSVINLGMLNLLHQPDLSWASVERASLVN